MGSRQISQPSDNTNAQEAYSHLLSLSQKAVAYARVKRLIRYPDGAMETDAEHSFSLSLLATELAATYFPELDAGLVAQFSNVHDLPELYAGDTPSFNISDEARAKKEEGEKAAHERLIRELPPHTSSLLGRYEKQIEPEARFVRFVDKLMPILVMTDAESSRTFKTDHKITSLATMHEIRAREAERLQILFPEFPFLHLIRDLAVAAANRTLFPDES